MKFFKNSDYVRYFRLFYKYLNFRIFKLLLLSFFVGILDGFGIALFIPLIQSSIDGIDDYSQSFGNFSFIFDFFQSIGFEINIYFILFLMISLFFLKGIFKFFDTYYKAILQSFFVKKLRHQMVNSLEEMKYSSFISLDSGEIQNTLSGEVFKVTASFISFFNAIQSLVLLLVYFGLAFLSNWQFAILVSIGAWLSNFLFKKLFYYTELASKNISSSSHKFQSYIIQAVHHFKYLKATSYFEKYKPKLLGIINLIEIKQKKIGYYNAILSGAREPVILIVIILVVFIQIRFVGAEIASIAMSLMFFYRALTYVMMIQSSWQGFVSNVGGIYSAEDLITLMREGKEMELDEKLNIDKFDFVLRNVSFGFNSNKSVLNNIDLRLPEKQTIAFVGPSGSGKSTLVNLIVGLMKPTSGNIFVGGKDIHQCDLRDYRKNIGYITQEPVVFNDTAFNNITFWAEKTPKNIELFYESLELVNLKEFIDSLEKGYDTILGDHGSILSGGQKQRISIAREIFKKVNVLVFDEATSSLDSRTEKDIQNNIDALKGKFTIFIIAHRLSTIKNCDKIVIIRDGRVTVEGDFNSLLESNSEFREMISYQKF